MRIRVKTAENRLFSNKMSLINEEIADNHYLGAVFSSVRTIISLKFCTGVKLSFAKGFTAKSSSAYSK